MNVALYIFDTKKNEFRFEVAEMDEIDLFANRKSRTIYVKVPNGNRYCVPTKDEKVIFDHLWLRQRDDEKARKLFKEYYEKKRKELDNQVVKLWRRIDLLNKISVTSGV